MVNFDIRKTLFLEFVGGATRFTECLGLQAWPAHLQPVGQGVLSLELELPGSHWWPALRAEIMLRMLVRLQNHLFPSLFIFLCLCVNVCQDDHSGRGCLHRSEFLWISKIIFCAKRRTTKKHAWIALTRESLFTCRAFRVLFAFAHAHFHLVFAFCAINIQLRVSSVLVCFSVVFLH